MSLLDQKIFAKYLHDYRGVQVIRTMEIVKNPSELPDPSELPASELPAHPCTVGKVRKKYLFHG